MYLRREPLHSMQAAGPDVNLLGASDDGLPDRGGRWDDPFHGPQRTITNPGDSGAREIPQVVVVMPDRRFSPLRNGTGTKSG